MFRPNLSAVLRRASSSVWVAVFNHSDFFQSIALTLVAAGVTWIVEAILPFCVYFAALHWMGLVLICQACWAGIVCAVRWGLHFGRLVASGVAFILSPLRPVWVDFRDGMIGTRIANILVLPILHTATTAVISIADLLCATAYSIYVLVTADRKQLADLSKAFFTQGYPYTIYSVFCCLALVVYGFIRRHRHSIIETLDGTDARVVPKQIACFAHFSIKACQLYPIGPEGLPVHIAEAVMLYFAAATEHYYILSPSIAFSLYMSTTTALMVIDRCTFWGSSLASQSFTWVLLTIVARLAILAFHERSRWDYIIDDVTIGSDRRLAWGMFAQLLTLPMGYYSRTTEWNWDTFKEKAHLIPEERFIDLPWQRFRMARRYYHGLPDSFFKSCSAVYGKNALVVIAIAETVKSLIWVAFAMLIGSIVNHLELDESQSSNAAKGHLFAVAVLLGSGYIVASGFSSHCRMHSKFNARGGILGGIFDRLFGLHTFEQHLAEDMALVTTNLAAFLEALDHRLSIPFQLFQLIVCCRMLWHHSGCATVLLAVFLGGLSHTILRFIRQHMHILSHLEQRIEATTHAINDFLAQPDAFLMTGDLATMEDMLVALQEKEVAAMARVNEFDVLRNTIGTTLCSPVITLALYGWYTIGNGQSSTGTLGEMFECFALLIITTLAASTLYEHMATRERNIPALNEMRRFFHPTNEEATAGPRVNQNNYMARRVVTEAADIPPAIIDVAKFDCLANPVGVDSHGFSDELNFWKASKIQGSCMALKADSGEDNSEQKSSGTFTSNPDDKEHEWIVIADSKMPESRQTRSISNAEVKPRSSRQIRKEERDKARWLGTSLRLRPQPRGKRRTRLAPAPPTADDSSGDERPSPKFFDSYDAKYDLYVARKHTDFEEQHPVRFTAGEDLGIMFNFDFGKHFGHRRGYLYRLTEIDYKYKMEDQAKAKLDRRLQRRAKKNERKDGRKIVREIRLLRKSARKLERAQKQRAKVRRLEKAKLAEQRKLETPEERKLRRAERRKRKMEENGQEGKKTPALALARLSDYDIIKSLGMAAPLPAIYQAPIMTYLTLIPDFSIPNATGEQMDSSTIIDVQRSSATSVAALEQSSSPSARIETTSEQDQLPKRASDTSSNTEATQALGPSTRPEEYSLLEIDALPASNLPLNSDSMTGAISSVIDPLSNGNGSNDTQNENGSEQATIIEDDTGQTSDQPRRKGKGPAPSDLPLEASEPRYCSERLHVSRPSLQGTGEGPSRERIISGSSYPDDDESSNTRTNNGFNVSGSDSDCDSDGTIMPESAETTTESLPAATQQREHRRVRFDVQRNTVENFKIQESASIEQRIQDQIQKDHDLAVRLADREVREVDEDEMYRDRQARDLEKRIAEACRQEQIERGAQLVERLRTQAVRRLALPSPQSLAPGRLEYIPVGIVPKTYIPIVEPNETVSWELADFAMIYQGIYRYRRKLSSEIDQKSKPQGDSSRFAVTATGHLIDPTLEDDQVRVEMDYKDILPCLPTARLTKRGKRAVVKEQEYLYDGSVGARVRKQKLSSEKQERKKKPKAQESKTEAEKRMLYDPQYSSHALVLATADRMQVLKPLSRRKRKGKKPRKDGSEYDEIDVMTSTIDTLKIRITRPPKVDKYGGYGDPDWTDSSATTGSDSSVLSGTDESSEDEGDAGGGNDNNKGGNGGQGNNDGSGGGGDGDNDGKKATVVDELADDYLLPTTTYCPPPPSTPKKKGAKKGTGKKGTGKKTAAKADGTAATKKAVKKKVTVAENAGDSVAAEATPVKVTLETIPETIPATTPETTPDKKAILAEKAASPKKKKGTKKATGGRKTTSVKRARFGFPFRPAPGIHGPSRAPGDPILEFNHEDDGDYGDDGTNMYDKFKNIDELAEVPPANLKTTHSRLATYNHADDSDSERELEREFEYSDLLHRIPEKGDKDAQKLIILKDALIAHEEGGEPVLKNVTMNIRANSITSIGGMPGTGKTTLLRCMMRRAWVASGFLELATGVKVAYAGQNSWFKTVPYRENIVGPGGFTSEFTYEWYMEVMGACMLLDKPGYENDGDTDLIMHESDKPSLKERQRIALARAIFAKPDVLLLDDPFSDQDEGVAQILFDQLLADKGLLRGKMAIIITSSDSRPFTRIADNVYLIKKSFEHKPGPRRVARMKGGIARRQSVKFWERAEWIVDETHSLESPVAPILESISGNMMRNHVLLNEAYSQGPMVTWAQVWKRGDPHRPFLCASLVLLAACCDNLGPALIGLLGNHPLVLRRVLVLGVLAKLMGMVLYCAAAWMFFMTVVPRALKDVSVKLIIACTQSSRLADHGTDRKDLGGLLLVMLRVVKTKLPAASFNTCVLGSQFLCVATVGAIASPWLIPIFGMCIFGSAKFAKAASRVQSEFDPLRERHGSHPTRLHFAETLQSLEQMQRLDWYDANTQWTSRMCKWSQKLFLFESGFHAWKDNMSRLWIMLTWLCVVGAGLFLNPSPHAFGITLLMLLQTMWTFPLLVASGIDYFHAMMSMGQLLDRIENLPLRNLDTEEEPPAWWPNSRRVDFDNVTVFSQEKDGTYTEMIRGFTFSMVYRHHHAFYDERTNRGAALHRALCKIVPYEGVIKFGGLDIKKIPLRRLLQYVQAIPGVPTMLPGTIRQNLVPSELLTPPRDPQKLQAMIDQVLLHMGLQNIIRDTSFLMRDIPLTADQQLRFMAAKALVLFYLRQQPLVFEDNLASNCGKWSRRVVVRAFNEIYRMQGRLILSDEPLPVHRVPLIGSISEYSGEVTLYDPHRNPEPFVLKGGPVYESD